jgi:molecular chaperone DnaK
MAGSNDAVRFEIAGKQYAPRRDFRTRCCASSADDASKYLGEKVNDAVITVPAYFNDAQRQATKDAGKIRRPQRASNYQRAHGGRLWLMASIRKKMKPFWCSNLGGGTFDVSLLDVGDGVFEVRATSGIPISVVTISTSGSSTG